MEVELSQRQLSNLSKGKPVQMKHSSLISLSPNVKVKALSAINAKKMQKAKMGGKGVRIQLCPEEAESIETSGGKIKMPKGLKKLGKAVTAVANKVDKGFQKEIVDSGVGKEIARNLIDIGTDVVLPKALSGLSMLAGDSSGMSGEIAGKVAGDQIQKVAGKYGYGLKGIALKAKKDAMTNLFKPVVKTMKQAKALTTKVFKEGEKVLDLPEISISGGKISWKKVGRDLKKNAKQLWRESKPVLKYFGEQALEMAEPLIEEGLASVAQSYGVDPITAEVGSKTLVSFGKKKAKRGLDKYLTKKPSQTPEMALDKVSAIVQERGDKLIQDAQRKGLEGIQKYVPPEQRAMATEMLKSQTSKAEEALRDKVESTESALRERISGRETMGRGRKVGRAVLPSGRVLPLMEGGAISSMRDTMRDDMGTLLSHSHPATTPFYPKPNLPQGQISGGSFRGYSGRGTLAMDTMLGGSFR